MRNDLLRDVLQSIVMETKLSPYRSIVPFIALDNGGAGNCSVSVWTSAVRGAVANYG